MPEALNHPLPEKPDLGRSGEMKRAVTTPFEMARVRFVRNQGAPMESYTFRKSVGEIIDPVQTGWRCGDADCSIGMQRARGGCRACHLRATRSVLPCAEVVFERPPLKRDSTRVDDADPPAHAQASRSNPRN